jgi:hypothetical protein
MSQAPEWLQRALAHHQRGFFEEFPAETMPLLTIDGYTLQAEDLNALLFLFLDRKVEFLTNLKHHTDPEQLYRFARWIYDCWVHKGINPYDKWVLFTFAELGGERAIITIGALIQEVKLGRKAPRFGRSGIIRNAYQALEDNASDLALFYLYCQWLGNGSEKNRQNALQRIDRLALLKSRSILDLALQVIPQWNYDGYVFDYGSRKFILTLNSELDLIVRDEHGKVRADLPKPGKQDVPELADSALAEWKKCQQFLHDVKNIQTRVLEEAMISENRWTWEDFNHIFLKPYLLRNFAQRLVWGVYEDGQIKQTFIVTADHSLSDAHYQPLEIEPQAKVGIVHPVNLSKDQQSLWAQVLHEYEILQPFQQIGRYVYRCMPEQLQANTMTCFTEVKIPRKQLTGYSLMKRHWLLGYDRDKKANFFRRRFANYLATLMIYPLNSSKKADNVVYRVELYFSLKTNQPLLPLESINPIHISEVMLDLTKIIL